MLIKTSSAVVAGMLSFTAGMLAGVLFAPATGDKTRRRLQRTGEDLVDKAVEVKESAEDLVARARRRLT